MDEVRDVNPECIRLMFTIENAEEVKEILQAFNEESTLAEGKFTRGHWKKGIK